MAAVFFPNPQSVTFRPSQSRSYDDTLPSVRTTQRTGYVRVLVFCNSCRHQVDADLQAIADAGRGDMPLTELRFRCSQCGTDRTDFVGTSRRRAAVVIANSASGKPSPREAGPGVGVSGLAVHTSEWQGN